MYKLTGFKAVQYVRENGGSLCVYPETVGGGLREDISVAEGADLCLNFEGDRVFTWVGGPKILHGQDAINYALLYHVRLNASVMVGLDNHQIQVDMLALPPEFIQSYPNKVLDIWVYEA